MATRIKLAVRDFALRIRPSGDLPVASSAGVLNLGIELHQAIQTRHAQTGRYKKEVLLAGSLIKDDYEFILSGRADGIWTEESGIIIEEIKTTSNLEVLEQQIADDGEHPYRLQAYVYCHLYELMHEKVATPRLLLVSSRNKREKVVELKFDREEFKSWIDQKLTALVQAEKDELARVKRRKKVSRSLAFPFETKREGQESLIQTVESHVGAGTPLMVQAPTGIGKTMGILFPVLKEAMSRGSQVLYLTPKNSQFTVAVEAVRLLQRAGVLKPKVLTLTAKTKACLMDEVRCDADLCRHAAGYFDRFFATKMPHLFRETDVLDATFFQETGARHHLCPYALATHALSEADVIVCDYNYVFSPRATLLQLFADRPKKRRLNLVVDEAHNLYERGMDYYSPSLTLAMCDAYSEAVEDYPEKLRVRCRRFASKVRERVLSLAPVPLTTGLVEKPDLLDLAEEAYGLMSDVMANDRVRTEPTMQFFVGIQNAVDCLTTLGDDACVYYNAEPDREGLRVKCLNASRQLARRIEEFHGVVLFSATLKPFEFFRALSGMPAGTVTEEFMSTFPKANRKVLVIPQVSTNFRERGQYVQKIADAVDRIIQVDPGHYIVFLPSYGFLNDVRAHLKATGCTILAQEPGLPASVIQEMAGSVKATSGRILLLGVQGGALAEGVDMQGDLLKGAIVVGPAMPSFDFERDQLRRYYDEHYSQGFQYAYTYPAMARSIQAAGRIIRSETKRGLLVFMDKRFATDEFASVMPKGWYENDVKELVSSSILNDIAEFWRTEKKESL